MFVGIAAFCANAQQIDDLKDGEKPAVVADRWVDNLDRKVALSDTQELDMKDILLAGFDEMKSIRGKYKGTLDQMKQEIKALRAKHGKVDASNSAAVRQDLNKVRMKFKPQIDAMKLEIRAVKDVARVEIRSVLTVEQKNKLRRANDQRKQQFRKRLQDRKKLRPTPKD